jgi:UDP-N-acetylmuramate dehydrogenase
MNLRERVPLAPLTTFHIGGPARFFVEAHTEEDIHAALREAQQRGLPVIPLGGGSNVVVPDTGVDGLVLKIAMGSLVFHDDRETTLIIVDAGARWDAVVDAALEHNLFGIENLAGIPGTIGGAAVQNIGAYGAELSSVFEYADVIETSTGTTRRIDRSESAFGYRTSFFKKNPIYIIIRVALRLPKHAPLNLTYKDLARVQATGAPLTTPAEIADVVRGIRKEKFPQNTEEGTAGSFFKNPVLSQAQTETLVETYPGLPRFPQHDGSVKISLAWVLDHILSLNGFSLGPARLYEKQPIVIVTRPHALATDVFALAQEIELRVYDALHIRVAHEVEIFDVKK